MAIQYRLTRMKDNISRDPKTGFYAQVVTRGTVDTQELCRDIANRCSLTVADMKAAIEALTQTVEKRLLDGYNVNIGDLGIFSVSAESKTVEEPDKIHGQSVKVKNVNFRPSVRLKETMKKSNFVRINKK